MDILTSIDAIEEWLPKHSKDAMLYVEGGVNETFLVVFAALVLRFREPDFPGNPRLRERLRLSSRLLAIWEFDYFRLSLRVETISGEETVILTRTEK